MIRQFRIDRYNGLEVLICECYRRHTWTQSEYDAFLRFNEERCRVADTAFTQDEFKRALNDFLEDPSNEGKSFYGLSDPIPVFDNFPCLVLRGIVVDNKAASLQADYVSSMLPPEILDEIRRFYGVFDSRHWRNMVSYQVEKYGSLFESEDD